LDGDYGALAGLAGAATDRGIDEPYEFLCFADEDGTEVTSALHFWNSGAEPSLHETLLRIVNATDAAWTEVAENA